MDFFRVTSATALSPGVLSCPKRAQIKGQLLTDKLVYKVELGLIKQKMVSQPIFWSTHCIFHTKSNSVCWTCPTISFCKDISKGPIQSLKRTRCKYHWQETDSHDCSNFYEILRVKILFLLHCIFYASNAIQFILCL